MKVKKKPGEEEEDPLELKLYRNPWVVKKKLIESDLDHPSRVTLPNVDVEKHILPFLTLEERLDVLQEGLDVWVYDMDTGTTHFLNFRKWKSNGSYKLGMNWILAFVKRRDLRIGDVIGMFRDHSTSLFYFSVLERSPLLHPPPPLHDGAATPPPPDPYLCEYAHKRLRLIPTKPDDPV